MINTLKQLIQKNSHWLNNPKACISFMKVSTPTSGTRVDHGKVVVLVFEEGLTTPTLCVKTVRVYAAGDLVKHNFENLKTLERGISDVDLSSLFSKPLYLHDDGTDVFSVESVCPGQKFSAQKHDVEFVIKKYTAWQAALSLNTKRILRSDDLQKIAHDAIASVGLSSEDVVLLQDYHKSLPFDLSIELPELIQHGDMTPDNVLVSSDAIHLIDYDYVGVSMVPGFDLFHFLSKSKSRVGSFRAMCRRYFPTYFQAIGADIYSYDSIFFIYYLQETIRKGYAGKNGQEIINDFEVLLSR